MKDLSLVPGIKELDMINLYALEKLTGEERQFVEKMNKVVEEHEKGKGEIFGFNEQIKIQVLWRKYKHLKPFQFRFNPEEKIPEVFKNKTAFIIWTVWRARHLVCEDDLVEEASITAARILPKLFPKEVKKQAIQEFLEYLHRSYPREGEVEFWEENIFPYLEGKWEFKWEIIQKCFCCDNDAVAICGLSTLPCSSGPGQGPQKPVCADCIAKIPDANIIKWLVPQREAKKEIQNALRKLKSKEIKA